MPLVRSQPAVGLIGLATAPAAAPWLWALLVGTGTGGAFQFSLALVLLRSRDAEQAVRLSAAAQGAGYVLASADPFGAGVLR